MIETMVALVTCGSREEAKKIAEALIGDQLAACVNIVPGIESCYRWEGKINWDPEFLLIIKTTAAAVDRVRWRVLKEHSYDLPEFIAFKIEDGSHPYLKWIEESVKGEGL